VRQLIPALRESGVHVHEFIPRVSKYPPAAKWLRPLWGGAALAARIPAVLATHCYDVVFLQRELVSTFLTLVMIILKIFLVNGIRMLKLFRQRWIQNGTFQRKQWMLQIVMLLDGQEQAVISNIFMRSSLPWQQCLKPAQI
jgi:hypothetical protein